MSGQLFIGGPLDGQTLMVSPSNRHTVRHMPDGHTDLDSIVIYRRGSIAGSTQSFPVWHTADMTDDDVIARLLAAYTTKTVRKP